MTDLLKMGLEHYYGQNYYAARDVWERGLQQIQDSSEEAAYRNALGAVYDVIRGEDVSREYFERAVQLESDVPLSSLAMKARTNLLYVLIRSGHVDTALSMARDTEKLPYEGEPLRQATFHVALLHVLSHAELYDEILGRIDTSAQLFSAVDSIDDYHRHFAMMYHYAGYAAQMLGRHAQAIDYYNLALEIRPSPETWRDLAKIYLLQDRIEDALACIDELYPVIWHLTAVTQKVELAHTLELLAMFAWVSGATTLYRKCTERAELYFGQESRWVEWLQVQDLGSRLNNMNVRINADRVDLNQWKGFLDELNLLDGFNAVFPGLWRPLQQAASLSTRIYSRCRGVGEAVELRLLEGAARLSYLGLTALTAVESEAVQILVDSSRHKELATLTLRSLETYPEMSRYIEVIKGCRTMNIRLDSKEAYMAASLNISLQYVESVEFRKMTHEQARNDILDKYKRNVPSDIIRVFTNLFSA
ncbi:hypothetical protein [Alicyclobacillus sp. SO9]|uniref:hypothetical protein n=1 Tax=Alicyclobacillus sp. SO9 TaxID=2665646 RepID=UPI0018E8B244|nr:hypothetical protein [Alicyclobacillus sp. SO9]QQE79446.1 hypothetical protein GI364_02800 [Alicyclobacillus sp. SO9]